MVSVALKKSVNGLKVLTPNKMISLALKGSANGLKVLSAKWHATPGIEELFQCFKGYWQITTTAQAVK